MRNSTAFHCRSTVNLILFWGVVLLGVLDWIVYTNGMALLQPFNRPERTAVLQAWHEFGPERTDIVFVGDSRTGCAFIPEVVDEELRAGGHDLRSYNFSGPGSTLPSDVGVVDYLFRVGARPKIIVMGVGKRQTTLADMAGFQRNEANPRLAYHLFRAEPCWQNVCTIGSALLRGPRVMLQIPLTMLPRYRARLATTRVSKGMGYTYSPLEGVSDHLVNAAAVPDDEEQIAASLHEDPNVHTPFQSHRTVEAALSQAVALARRLGCGLVVVNMPKTRLHTAIENEYGYAEYLAWLRGFAAERDVHFVDMNEAPWLPPDSDFADTHHLSPAGAESFSRAVTQRLLIPELEAIGE